MANRDPMQLLKVDRRQALQLAEKKGIGATRKMLQQAQRELDVRLRKVEGLRGPGSDSFTAAQLRVVIRQLELVMSKLQGGMKKHLVDEGTSTAEKAAQHTLQYIHRADQKFTGIAQRLPIREAAVLDRAVSGAKSSVLHRLEGDRKKGPGILERYGDNVVKGFEQRLQLRLLTKQPWEDVRNDLIASSPFLQKPEWPGQPISPKFWAERIVRTETMNAHNRAQWEGLRAVNKEVGGGMLKMLVATFDSRTGADSYALHGQIRRPHEAFEDWYHLFQHPPNRPNDRETVVPHNMAWPIPSALAWKSDAEVSARWVEQGNKRALPARPKMTTVPIDQIGRRV